MPIGGNLPKDAKVRRGLKGPLYIGSGVAKLVLVLMIISPEAGHATRSDSEISGLCDRAAFAASQSKGVPLDVLLAISRTETGRRKNSDMQPWPWAVNMEGKGRWFSNIDEARSYVFTHFKNGARSFDVGCFQINYKWHGEGFRSIDDMFDPVLNAEYAAGFLTGLYQEFGNWSDAAGAYHSRNIELAREYTVKFDLIRAALAANGVLDATAHLRKPPYSLSLNKALASSSLLRGGTLALGSLVPMDHKLGSKAQPYISFE